MRGTSAAGCTQMVKRQGREKCLGPRTESRELGFPAKSLQGWGRYAAMAVGLAVGRDGESGRREERGEGRKSIYSSFL